MRAESASIWAVAAAFPLATGAYVVAEPDYASHDLEVAAPFEQRVSVFVPAMDIAAFSLKQRLATPSSASEDPLSFRASADEQSTAEQIQEFRRLTGLTWAQVAEVFEVSARAPFDWASGKNVSSKNRERVAGALAALRHVDRGSAEQNNALLRTAALGGETLLDLLKGNRLADFKRQAGAGSGRPDLGRVLSADAARHNEPVAFWPGHRRGKFC